MSLLGLKSKAVSVMPCRRAVLLPLTKLLRCLLILALAKADRYLPTATACKLKICPLTRVPSLVMMVVLLYCVIVKGSEERRKIKDEFSIEQEAHVPG